TVPLRNSLQPLDGRAVQKQAIRQKALSVFWREKFKINYDHRHGGDVDGLFRLADNAVDGAVEKFASAFGWKGSSEASDSTKSAIGFLERK
ncbi:hypothetical protein CP989_25200, partial [Enterobacter hormaechei]